MSLSNRVRSALVWAFDCPPWVGGACVLVLALVLRLALLPTARFGGDEALYFRQGMDIVEGKGVPLLGPQITDGAGRLPGPAFLVTMALPLLAWHAPEAQYAFVEILGALAVAVFWHAMRRPFGERGALFAGVLMAMSPWSALYADRTWNPNVLPLVLSIALLAAIRLREQPSSRWVVAFLPLMALMPQFHMSAPVAWLGLSVLVAQSIPRWNVRHAVLGLGLAAALYVPFLVHEVTTGFGNTRHILAETVGTSQRHPTSFLWVPVYALRFLSLDVTYHELSGYWGGPDEVACIKAAVFGSPPRPFHLLRLVALGASILLAATALIVAARDAGAAWRRERRVPLFALAFLAALAGNMALLGLSGKQVFGHYVTNLFPFVFVAYAALGRAIVRPSILAAAAVLLAALFCVGGTEATLSVSRRVDGRIGLEVHRRTLEQIRNDGVADGLERESVNLEFSYRSSWFDWHIFATRAMHMPIHFDRRASRRVYRLVEKDKPLPPGRTHGEPVDVGHALLYRMRR